MLTREPRTFPYRCISVLLLSELGVRLGARALSSSTLPFVNPGHFPVSRLLLFRKNNGNRELIARSGSSIRTIRGGGQESISGRPDSLKRGRTPGAPQMSSVLDDGDDDAFSMIDVVIPLSHTARLAPFPFAPKYVACGSTWEHCCEKSGFWQ
jgi:hypothetical protein